MSSIKGIKVGSSVITASFTDGGVTKTITQTLKVEAQPLGSIAKAADVTYTGAAFTPTPAVSGSITVSGHPVVGTDFTYSYSNNVNVGTATVTATGKDNYTGSVSSTFTIKAATITVSAPNQSFVYDGKSHGNAITATSVNSQTITIKYGTASGTYTTTTVPTYVNAGSYTVYYQVTAQYHATKTGNYVINIGKADQPMTISPVSKTIYNTVGYNTFKIVPSGNQGVVTYSTGNANYATVGTDGTVTYVGAGTVVITVTAAGNDNYKSGSKTCTVTCVVDTKKTYADLTGTITFTQTSLLPAKGLTLTASNVSSYAKYTSTANQKITWVSGNVTNGTITYSAFVGDNVSIPTLGSDATTTTTSRTVKYTITATGEGGKTLSGTLTSLNQEINKLESISLSLTPSTIKYGGLSTPAVVATYTSTATKDVSGDAKYTSGTPIVAEIQ